MTPLLLNDTFKFSCSKHVPCFNECCQDLNQILTPYDVLRLKNHLGISSSLFLERYTSQQIGHETGLPVIVLKTDDANTLKCPFVTSTGCGVYDDRPSSCRAYPLVRVASRSRETGRISEQYLLLKEPHCLGFNEGKYQTVGEWIEAQDISVYNQMNDMLIEIIGLKNRLIPGQLDTRSKSLFHMACYDLDKFRSRIFDIGILDDQNLDTETLNSVKNNDDALLKFGLKWIKHILIK
jgi:Fe-S-cluster containining protein